MKLARKSNCLRWTIVVLYAIAMAWVESTVVFYLRTMIDRIEPYQPNPFPLDQHGFGWVELLREFATIIMLFTVGLLAGRTWRARWGYFVIGFGTWDIFYYVFLKVMCGWPHGLLDWDVLFLLPLPWWGPVLAPVMIALLMILWGTLEIRRPNPRNPKENQNPNAHLVPDANSGFGPRISAFGLCGLGVFLALYTFTTDTLAAAPHGLKAVCNVLPQKFNWPLFGLAWLLMAAPLLCAGRQRLWPRPAKSNLNAPTQNLNATAP